MTNIYKRVNLPLTRDWKRENLWHVMKLTNPAKMIEMAESLEATAKALRQSAEMFKQFAAISAGSPEPVTPAASGGTIPMLSPITHPGHTHWSRSSVRPPTVLEAVKQVLTEHGKPMHLNDIFQHIIARGAQIKEIGNLSSMLSRDNGENFVIPAGQRGFWWLAPNAMPPVEESLSYLEPRQSGEIHPAR